MKSNTEQKKGIFINAPKKAYKKPKLLKIGNVKNLTLGEGSLNFDEGSVVEDFV